MRHALRTRSRDSTARFLSLTPSFRRKERKMPAKLLFRPLTPVPARAIIFLPTSHCIRGPYIPPPNHTCKRDSSKFGLLRELPKYYLPYSCTLSELCAFYIATWQDADRFCFEISLWASFFPSFFIHFSLFSKNNTFRRKDVKEMYE